MVHVREAARVVLLDGAGRVLLVRFETPEGDRVWWATPGGGVEAGESHEQAARRELWEETGLRDVDLGPHIWNRRHIFELAGVRYDQRERYFLAAVDAFEPRITRLDRNERDYVRGLRWWSLPELRATSEELAPTDLVRLLNDLIDNGPPSPPVDVGV